MRDREWRAGSTVVEDEKAEAEAEVEVEMEFGRPRSGWLVH
jgi:hypothetical protein